MNELLRRYAEALEALDAQGLLRRLPAAAVNGQRLLDFSGNDYLGLAARPELVAAAAEAGQRHGAGSTGSRLLSGNLLLAYGANGIALPPEMGYPFIFVAEDKWGYKWARWVSRIELSSDPSYKGYWEGYGYSNEGNLDQPSR